MSSQRFLTLSPRHLPILLVLMCVLLISGASHTTADACASCMNRGKLLMPNNIFGFCRCKCSNSFQGPRCQFAKKKRTSLSPLGLGWGSQLFEGAHDEEDALLATLSSRDETMIKLILQQLYSHQLPQNTGEDEDRRRRRR